METGMIGSGTTYSWKLVFTGGPLGHTTEHATLEEPAAKAVAKSGQFHPGDWIPAVQYFGKWLSVPVVKWDTVACAAGPLLV